MSNRIFSVCPRKLNGEFISEFLVVYTDRHTHYEGRNAQLLEIFGKIKKDKARMEIA